ncbi:MAG TPA: NAD-dependent epimerase/dehydratase family protein [Acidimicrobiales bacterium]|nr:NAD-dependent epimerase/dehydratase family protein [Acidimicrobiales bacterium]
MNAVNPARRACITGGAGFIGSNLAERLIEGGSEVVVVDDFRTGKHRFLESIQDHPRFSLLAGDVLDPDVLKTAFAGCDWVFHLQANADVRHGFEHPRLDLDQNTTATSQVLEAMRTTGVQRILFASSGSVYGEPQVFPTPEDAPFPQQTSFYGASKLAGEALIAAYSTAFGMTGVICRFVSILGERYTHGHVVDFYRALKRHPTHLTVLGDGRQEKSYLYVQDCIDAMLAVASRHGHEAGTYVYNLGTDETIFVDESVEIISSHLGATPEIVHTGGIRGWIGDSPQIHLDTARIRNLGWSPKVTIRQAIELTLDWLDANEYAWRDGGVAPQGERGSRR